MQEIPFDALRTSKNEYLLENHTIEYAFSAQTYFNHSPETKNRQTLAFFPDFTNTAYAKLNQKEEHFALKSFKEYTAFHQQQATKEQFIKHCNNTGILHIASHLVIDTTRPMQSALVFQPNTDYLLSINEIWKLKANSQLITLVACESNFGKEQTGEGTQNFAWAFHYAGAHHILSTQWNAADKSSSVIISNYYKYLKDGLCQQAALQLAKIQYLKQADAVGAEPYFWAHFSLFGDATDICIEPDYLSKSWCLPLLSGCIIFLLILSCKKVYLKYDA